MTNHKKLAPRAVEILRHLARQRDHNAKTTRYYFKDWRHLANLRAKGFIEDGRQNDGAPVTPDGRRFLRILDIVQDVDGQTER